MHPDASSVPGTKLKGFLVLLYAIQLIMSTDTLTPQLSQPAKGLGG
jgi:hypothetical protein